jgi:uncharacterized membrane protein YgcG
MWDGAIVQEAQGVLPTRVASEILADAALKALLRKGAYSEAVVHALNAIERLLRDQNIGHANAQIAHMEALFREDRAAPSSNEAHSSGSSPPSRLLNPRTDASCGGGRYVCDHTDLLGGAAYRQIDGMLSTFESQYKTQCGSSMRGLRVGVAITDTAKPYPKIGEYADALYRHWGLGQPCDNGILVALAISDRQSTIVSGKVRLPSRAAVCIAGVCAWVGTVLPEFDQSYFNQTVL